MSSDQTAFLQKKMEKSFNTKVLFLKKIIEQNKTSIRFLKAIQTDQLPHSEDSKRMDVDVEINVGVARMNSYPEYREAITKNVIQVSKKPCLDPIVIKAKMFTEREMKHFYSFK